MNADPPGPLLHPFARPAAGRNSFTRIIRGEGALIYDETGRRYVDAMASLWYCNVGHGRKEIARAVADQIEKLENYHLFERFVNPRAESWRTGWWHSLPCRKAGSSCVLKGMW